MWRIRKSLRVDRLGFRGDATILSFSSLFLHLRVIERESEEIFKRVDEGERRILFII